MNIYKVIKNEQEYNIAVERAIQIFDAQPGTSDFDELELLGVLIKDYEDNNYQIPVPDTIQVIKDKMIENGLKNKDLMPLIGSEGHVSAILSGKRKLTLDMARDIKDLLGVPAEILLATKERTEERTLTMSNILSKAAREFNVMGQGNKKSKRK